MLGAQHAQPVQQHNAIASPEVGRPREQQVELPALEQPKKMQSNQSVINVTQQPPA